MDILVLHVFKQGYDGPTGETGSAGDKGPKGPGGSQGPKGIKGIRHVFYKAVLLCNCNHQLSEMYFGPFQKSLMELFNDQPLTIFTKKLSHSCLTGR